MIEVLDALLQQRIRGPEPGTWWLPPDACQSAHAVIPIVPRDGVERVAQVIAAADGLASTLAVAFAARLVHLGMIDRANALADTLATREHRERAWCRMLTRLPEAERTELWQQLNDSVGDDSRVWRYLDENIEDWVASVGAETCLNWVRRAERLPHGLTTSWRSLVAIAQCSSVHGPSIAAQLLDEAARLDPDDHEALFGLTPLRPYLSEQAVRRLIADLLACLSGYPRSDLLNNWTGENLGALVPVLEQIAGEAGVYAVAKQVVQVGEWFP